MREWQSIVLMLFVLHLWRTWRPMTGYSRRMPMALALLVSALAAGAFLMPTGQTTTAGGPPQFRLAHLVMTQPLKDLAPAVGLTPNALTDRLNAAGYTLASSATALTDISSSSGKLRPIWLAF